MTELEYNFILQMVDTISFTVVVLGVLLFFYKLIKL